jgi:hypothetical protein
VGGGLTHLRALLRLVVEWAHLAIDARRLPDDELFLRAVYHACLKREPDREGGVTTRRFCGAGVADVGL